VYIYTHTYPVYINLASGDEAKIQHFSHHPASSSDMQGLTNFRSPRTVTGKKERTKDFTFLLLLKNRRLETVIFQHRSKLILEIRTFRRSPIDT